ncbi:hypothetical protein BDF22DRAFT_774227 [Syncephalis plumigaleata]|nr:hypothetical protein BDF22DRAFT_774227 [Syncephalis plumigaleata]
MLNYTVLTSIELANDDVSKRWVTLPVGIEGKLIQVLRLQKLSAMVCSAMGVATYNNQKRFIKCSYFGMGRGEDKILKEIAKAKQNISRWQYFVDHIETFKTGLPSATAETVKKYRPSFLPKKIPYLDFGRCIFSKPINFSMNKIIYNNMKSSDIFVRGCKWYPHIKLVDFDMSVINPPEFGNGSGLVCKGDTWYIGARLFQLITGKKF